jgi:hypothetical protein
MRHFASAGHAKALRALNRQESEMLELFREGGMGMYPVLVFGLVLLTSAARYAWDIEPARLRFVVATSVLLIVTMIHAMLTNVAEVFWTLSSVERTPDNQVVRILFEGLKLETRADSEMWRTGPSM